MTASSSISSSSFTVSDATRGQHVISTHAGTPLSPHTRPIKQQQHKQPQPPQQRQASSFNGNRNSARLRQRELAAAALNRRVYPDHPIGFEYTIYYPGNMDLIITAGHGGYNAPGEVLSPRLTHIYRPCLSQEREGERDSTGDGEWTRRTVVDSIDCFAVPVVDDEPLAAAAAAEGNVDGLYPPPLPLQTPPSSSHSAHTTAESGQPPPPPPQYQHQQQLPGLVTRPPRSRAHQPTHQEKFMLPPGPITTMPNLPLRDTSRGGNFRGDMNTSTLAMHLALSISDLLVSSAQQPQSLVASRPRPHVVLFRVPRRFVDVNRNISNPEENAVPENSSESAAAWHEYHGVIDHVRALIETGIERRCQKQRHRGNKDNQRGLLLDIHGHTHATELIEIGYLLDGATLAQEDAVLDARAAELAQIMSTLSPFKEWRKEDVNTPLSFSSILRGPNDSLGGMFQQQGLNAVPSPRNQAPCDECLFFFGGYTIQRHGSRDGGNTDAIQLELPKSLRFVEREEMRVISMQMARAVVEFLGRYYDLASTTATDDRSMQDRSARATSASVTVVMARPILSSLPPQGPGVLVAAAAAAATAVGNRNLMHHPSTTGLYRSYSSPLSASSRHRAVDNESGDDDSDQERVSRSNRQTAKAAAIVAASDEPRPALLRKSSRL